MEGRSNLRAVPSIRATPHTDRAQASAPQLDGADASATKSWAALLVVLAQLPRALALVVMERMLKVERPELFWVWM